jgi:hypothetical protein
MLLDPLESLVYTSQEITVTEAETCHLTETELRRLHRRFGHPSAARFMRVLERGGHEVNFDEIKRMTKYCQECQMNGRSPGRFKFTLRDDHEFNHSVYLDVLWLDSKAVLQVVDEATVFQAARFLKDMSAKEAWNAFRACWIDVYLGPPAFAIHDPGTNFNSKEFRDNARVMDIETRQMPVEAHNSIGLIERYHVPLRRAYNILLKELPDLLKEERL